MKLLFAGTFMALGLLSVAAWRMQPEALAKGTTPLVWVSDDNPARRGRIALFNRLYPQYQLRLDFDNGGMEKVIVQSLAGAGRRGAGFMAAPGERQALMARGGIAR